MRIVRQQEKILERVALLKVIHLLVAYYFSYREHGTAAKGSPIDGMRWATIGRQCNVHNMHEH